MTIETPHTIAVWAEGTSPTGEVIMGADTPSGLPWPMNRADLIHFRQATRDHVLVMGSATYEKLPDELKLPTSTAERPIIILTSRLNHYISATRGLGRAVTPINPTGTVEHGVLLANLRHWPEYAGKPVAVIGGPRVIEAFEPYYDELVVSYIPGRHEGHVPAPETAFLDNFIPNERTVLDGNVRVTRFVRRLPKEN